MKRSIFINLKNYFNLLMINLMVKLKTGREFLIVVFRYYRHFNFCKIDLTLLAFYFFNNPFSVSKQFLIQKGQEDVYTYGETPLSTLDLIAQNCQLTKQDKVIELGCGRGRTCFWLNQFVGCSVIGVDHLPLFIEKANQVKQQFHLQPISFRLEDLFKTDLTDVTVIYLYGTCFSTASIIELIKKFSSLAVGTKIITVSYALTDYQSKAHFKLIKKFTAPFTWGNATVYLQVKKN